MAEAPTLSGRVVVVVLSSYVWLQSQKRRVVTRGGGLLSAARGFTLCFQSCANSASINFLGIRWVKGKGGKGRPEE